MANVLALALLLDLAVAQASEVPAAPGGSPAPPPASVAPPTRPTLVTVPPASAPTPATTQPKPPPSAPTVEVPVVQAVIEKIGQGDRHFLDRDYRAALFAYQDAVYLAPGHAPARVRLGRAYLALRYPDRAAEQAERALAIDPANVEARKLLDEARSPAPRPVGSREPREERGPFAPRAPAPVTEPPATPPPSAQPPPRVYRFTPEPEPPREPQPSQAGPPAVAPQGPAAPAVAAVDPGAPPAPSAADRYRAGVALLGNREFEKAVGELTEAIAADPRLAVAYAARASARFGLGRYREAVDDYGAALGLDPNLATPLYGLAECYRVLGEPAKASDMYQRYAESRSPDVREDLRVIAAKRAKELR